MNNTVGTIMDTDLSYKDDNDLHDTIDMVETHIEEHFNKLGEIIRLEITEELKDCIQSIIRKTNQHTELMYERNKRQLQKSYEKLPNKIKKELPLQL